MCLLTDKSRDSGRTLPQSTSIYQAANIQGVQCCLFPCLADSGEAPYIKSAKKWRVFYSIMISYMVGKTDQKVEKEVQASTREENIGYW